MGTAARKKKERRPWPGVDGNAQADSRQPECRQVQQPQVIFTPVSSAELGSMR